MQAADVLTTWSSSCASTIHGGPGTADLLGGLIVMVWAPSCSLVITPNNGTTLTCQRNLHNFWMAQVYWWFWWHPQNKTTFVHGSIIALLNADLPRLNLIRTTCGLETYRQLLRSQYHSTFIKSAVLICKTHLKAVIEVVFAKCSGVLKHLRVRYVVWFILDTHWYCVAIINYVQYAYWLQSWTFKWRVWFVFLHSFVWLRFQDKNVEG